MPEGTPDVSLEDISHESNILAATKTDTPESHPHPDPQPGYTAHELEVLWHLSHKAPPTHQGGTPSNSKWDKKQRTHGHVMPEDVSEFLANIAAVTAPEEITKFLLAHISKPTKTKYLNGDTEWWDILLPELPKSHRATILTALSTSKIPGTRAYVALKEDTPPETLSVLAHDDEYVVQNETASNPSTPPETLTFLSTLDDNEIDTRLSKNRFTPPETLTKLAQFGETSTRSNVAENPSTPPETLVWLSQIPDTHDGTALCTSVAYNPSTPPETLTQLSVHPDEETRQGVATNTSTPPHVLELLSAQEGLRYNIAWNTSTPPETLTQLACEDDDVDVRRMASRNPATPPHTLTQLAFSEDPQVVWNVAWNTSTPPHILVRMIAPPHTATSIRHAVASNPNTPTDTLYILSQSTEDWTRRGVIKNPATPPEILLKLTHDPHKDVKRMALKRVKERNLTVHFNGSLGM